MTPSVRVCVLTCQTGWAVLEEYRTSYLSGPPSKSGGLSQRKISSVSMVWMCERLAGALGFTAEGEQVVLINKEVSSIALSGGHLIPQTAAITAYRIRGSCLFVWLIKLQHVFASIGDLEIHCVALRSLNITYRSVRLHI